MQQVLCQQILQVRSTPLFVRQRHFKAGLPHGHVFNNHKITSRANFIVCSAEVAEASETGSVDVWLQKQISLRPLSRGCHIVTKDIYTQMQEISEIEIGLANIFIMHTSASLTINENASPDVPKDLNDSLDRIVPEGNMYRHLDEGYDDMPAHVKSSLMGPSLTIPIRHGKFALGMWQGVYLNEHRNYGGSRSLMITIQGRKRADGKKYHTPFFR
eukprot:TRINITY_DN720_c0_g1_i1.p2 TRINITY_DN720_c0_g1~~TRINITY_DN720_c0_g1_i1.p2  ORF type:complete len:232 (-),score=15.23 TRINITY_DN720_c0_g1_i1:204-848(-)